MISRVLGIFLLSVSICQGYVITKSSSGDNVRWQTKSKEIFLTVSPIRSGNNSSSLSNTEINQIIANSVEQWNQASNFKIYPDYINSQPTLGIAQTISFTTNPAYFGSGTLAITSLGYSPKTGEVISGDILINESLYNSVIFTDKPAKSSGNEAYLGDIVTHEIGHLLGLSHSEAPGASMSYAVFKGMYSLHDDDIHGVKRLYGPTSGGEIYGRVVGGNQIGIFGVNVNLISHSTGELVTNVLSDTDGAFRFKNLSNDKYVIYIQPIKSKDNLPKYYYSANANYCNGDYLPSFFTKCGGREVGRPQVISLENSESLEVGEVTIRCNTAHNPAYIKEKTESFDDPFELREQGDYTNLGQTLHGMFYKDQVDSNTAVPDEFEVNLTDIDNSSGLLFLDLKFLVESLGSAVELKVSVRRKDEGSAKIYYVEDDILTGKKELNLKIKKALSTVSSNNIFTITVTPLAITSTEIVEIFGNNTDLINDQHTYAILQGLSQNTISGDYDLVGTKEAENPDSNYYCTEGRISEQTNAYLTSSNSSAKELNQNIDSSQVSCATIDIEPNDGPPMGGMLSFCLGLMLFLLPKFRRFMPAIFLS